MDVDKILLNRFAGWLYGEYSGQYAVALKEFQQVALKKEVMG